MSALILKLCPYPTRTSQFRPSIFQKIQWNLDIDKVLLYAHMTLMHLTIISVFPINRTKTIYNKTQEYRTWRTPTK